MNQRSLRIGIKGPTLTVGDRVEKMWMGKMRYGVVTSASEMFVFVHYDGYKYDIPQHREDVRVETKRKKK
jgi:hypothetical protein